VLVSVVVHAARAQDPVGTPAVLKSILERWPWLRHVFADGGYAGLELRGALQKIGKFTMEIVKRSDSAKGFEVLPREWAVKRTFHGWADAEGWPAASSDPTNPSRYGTLSPTCACLPDVWQVNEMNRSF
jgi:transposase